MSEWCKQKVVATDVTLITDDCTQHWDKLEAHCKRHAGHGGVHSYGPWLTEAGGEAFPPPPNDCRPAPNESDG